MSYTYEYPRPAVTADMIVLTDESEPKILLIQRGSEPFKGCWALTIILNNCEYGCGFKCGNPS
jgi:hypothetical protein